MDTIIRVGVFLVTIASVQGCAVTPKNNYVAVSSSDKIGVDEGLIAICRPSAFFQGAISPDLLLDDHEVANLPSGAVVEIPRRFGSYNVRFKHNSFSNPSGFGMKVLVSKSETKYLVMGPNLESFFVLPVPTVFLYQQATIRWQVAEVSEEAFKEKCSSLTHLRVRPSGQRNVQLSNTNPELLQNITLANDESLKRSLWNEAERKGIVDNVTRPESVYSQRPQVTPPRQQSNNKVIADQVNEANKAAATAERKRREAEEAAQRRQAQDEAQGRRAAGEETSANSDQKFKGDANTEASPSTRSTQIDFHAEATKAAKILGCQPLEVKLTGADAGVVLFSARCADAKNLSLGCDKAGLCLKR